MSSPILTIIGFDLPAGLGDATAAYMPDVEALRGASSIEEVITVGSALKTLILVTVPITGSDTNQLTGWEILAGAADVNDPENQVAPLDYNAATNDVHWQRVAGFGSSFLAGARLTRAAAFNIANNVATAIPFDTQRFNSGGWIVSDPSKITIRMPGIHAPCGSVSFAADAVGQREIAVRVNGSTVIASKRVDAASSGVTNLAISTEYEFQVGDYVELLATQNSGNTLDVLKANAYSPEFSVLWVGSNTVVGTPITTGDTPPSSTPPGSTTDVELPFTITDIGWYRVWQGAYPASGNFNIKRLANADGQTSDSTVDFTIIADSPEGIINVGRNSVPNTGSPSIDAVRVYHDETTLLAYVEVHLTRADAWVLRHAADDNYLDAPYLVADMFTADGSLIYSLKPNVTGGTGTIDVPQVDSGDAPLVRPRPGITWAPATGVAARTAFDTGTATLTQVSQRLKAIIDDLIFAGLFREGIPSPLTYSDMLALAVSLVTEGAVANVSDIFRVSVAPDTTVQGIYVKVGTFNAHDFYKIQGYEYEAAGQNSARQCYWSSAWNTWTISNAGGNLYHSGAAEANPWDVAQWKDQANVNVAVTEVAPNIALTYNALTDTHTSMILTGSSTGYNGLYLRGTDLNSKRRYFLVGTGSNNKRIEWSGSGQWQIKDDSATYATSNEDVTYPDQVNTWTVTPSSDVIKVGGVNAVDLMSGVTVGDPSNTYNGIYVPVQGVYNALGGRKLIYRRLDSAWYIQNSGAGWNTGSGIGVITGGAPVSDTDGNFPWNASWTTSNITAQQNKIASPGWNNTLANNAIGSWHI